MAWSFSPDRPVYVQLSEIIRKRIVSGEYSPAEQIPSVRQLAVEAAVNPNTVQRALADLESDGLVESHGTLGRFVTAHPEVISAAREEDAKKLVLDFITSARQMSLSDEIIEKMIKEELYERS